MTAERALAILAALHSHGVAASVDGGWVSTPWLLGPSRATALL